MIKTASITTVSFQRREYGPFEMGLLLDDLSIVTLTGERVYLPYWDSIDHRVDGSIMLKFDEELQALVVIMKPGQSPFHRGRPLNEAATAGESETTIPNS